MPQKKTAFRFRFALGGALLALIPAVSLAAMPRRPEPPQIIAYVFPRNRVLGPRDVDVNKLTRVNYAFANIEDGRIAVDEPTDPANLATLVAQKQQNPSLQVLVSVGGWVWSDHFSDMALTHASRARFIESVVAFLQQYKLDGLDIDWEYPGMAGSTNHFRPEDKRNYTLLIRELRARFNQEQRRWKRPLFLSVAVGSSQNFIDHTEMKEAARALDTVNLMAYDYYEPGGEKITGHNAPLYVNPADPKHESADVSVVAFEQAGVPPRKLVLGVPFYGHIYGNVPPENDGLFEPGAPVPGTYASYGNIVTTMLGHGFMRHWDASAAVPYLYNPQTRQFVSYDDPQSMKLKCAYVRQKGLGGIMFWDYASDPTGTLLDTIYTDLYGAERKAGQN